MQPLSRGKLTCLVNSARLLDLTKSMRLLFASLSAVLGLFLPIVIYVGIVSNNLFLPLCVILAFGLCRAYLAEVSRPTITAIAVCSAVFVMFFVRLDRSGDLIKLYPVIMNFVVSSVFAFSLRRRKSVLEVLAERFTDVDRELNARPYLRALTGVWAALIFLNGCISAWTSVFSSLEFWVLYNTLYAYGILAAFALLEWLYRQHYKRRQIQKASSDDNG